jgi:hypothetical protein
MSLKRSGFVERGIVAIPFYDQLGTSPALVNYFILDFSIVNERSFSRSMIEAHGEHFSELYFSVFNVTELRLGPFAVRRSKYFDVLLRLDSSRLVREVVQR